MATFHLDSERGNNANDGTTEALAVKTALQASIISSLNDTIIVYPGAYPRSIADTFNFARHWEAKYRNTVVATNDIAGPYLTHSTSTVATSQSWTRITFLDFDDPFIDQTTTGGGEEISPRLIDCDFINCEQIVRKTSAQDIGVRATGCVFSGCGKSLPIFDILKNTILLDGCVFYNNNAGINDLFNMSSSTANFDFVKNNIFQANTAKRIWNFSTFGDAATIFLQLDFNTYFSNTLSTGFALTSVGEKAAFSNWKTDTVADPQGLTTDPEFIDPLKRLFAVKAGGNSDTTGAGGGFRGALGIGFGMSTNINGATEWDNFTVSPAGEIVLNGGNWEHAGTDSIVATVESTVKDLGSIRKITTILLAHQNDPPEGIIDTTLADGKRTLEWKFSDALPITMAYVEVNRGDPTLDTTMRFVQFRITERNDG